MINVSGAVFRQKNGPKHAPSVKNGIPNHMEKKHCIANVSHLTKVLQHCYEPSKMANP